MTFPKQMKTQLHSSGHIQGFAFDAKGYLYCSFTTELAKYDPEGNLVGSVRGMAGHLGCLAIGPDDRIYGSLEYADDECTVACLEWSGRQAINEIAFYIAIFDGDKITRMNMDAYADGIMETVYLPRVVHDYVYEQTCDDGSILKHKYGCAGIDGVTFAPLPGEEKGSRKYLHVAYGIYDDVTRRDNDYQIIHAYDTTHWHKYEQLLDEQNLHKSGPIAPHEEYFIYTGNTTYGVQNLEYDEEQGFMFMTVYRGKKPTMPNYPLYIADWTKKPVSEKIAGYGETKEVVPLVKRGLCDASGRIWGWEFPYGSTGIVSLGEGLFYISQEGEYKEGFDSVISLYRWTGEAPYGFEQV